MTLPDYYLSWKNLAQVGQQGAPILMYHKIARPRVGWRGRGALLYVGPSLFHRQLQELREAGIASQTLDWVTTADDNRSPGIVLTFDDGFENLHTHAMEAMARQGFQGIAYLVADRLGGVNEWEIPLGYARERLMDAEQIREWLAAGHAIGAHTLTHPHLTQISLAAAREEISASKKNLEDLFGVSVDHFCYPYGDHDERVCAMVSEAGYHTATITKRGLNTKATPPLTLRRFMARYPKYDLPGWWHLATGR